jgi:WXG100 family type VII secretion target
MTTIHMDIEAMRRIQNELMEIQGQIQNKVLALRRNYQGLPNAWIGSSANEYFDHYTEFDGNVTNIVERIGEIASELSAEIANYENMDNGLFG